MSKITEEWRDIQGYEGLYQVSDWGNVRSLGFDYMCRNQYGSVFLVHKNGKTLKPNFDSDGYLVVTVAKDGVYKNKKIHRLVAEAFIPNPENKPFVGHTKTLENGLEDKTANEAWNLKWMTPKENSNYGTLPQRMQGHGCKAVDQIDPKTGVIVATFPSIVEAAKCLNIKCPSNIVTCCTKKTDKIRYGFLWRHHNEDGGANLPPS